MPVEITKESLTRALDGREGLFSFLRDKLNWPLDLEDTFTYDEPDVAGRASAHADVSRLVNFTTADPFVIFLVEFHSGFSRTALREILRGIRRKIRERAAYNTVSLDEIIFVCAAENYGGLRFAHFEEQEGKQPRLRVFGFDRDVVGETYTLRKENLSRLALSLDKDDQPDWNTCKKEWLEAWNVEKVTKAFFEQYEKTFNAAKEAITGFVGTDKDKQIFTQRIFNRLLFIHFLSKRGWLTFNGRTDYLFALWDGRDKTENFYQAHLSPLFFAGLNNPQSLNLMRDNPALFARIGTVPFLNGGLFDKAEEEKANTDVVIPDSVFEDIFHNLFACYNFTIAESTPDDIEVAVDPEMLGKVFEKLITDEDRGSKGAFYTPRSVVVFMCEEAIKGYLSQALPKPEKPDAIERLVNEKDDHAVTVAEAKQLLAALENVRVVDPACGSGAYLLGMMQTIFDLMRLLDTRAETAKERDNYDRKLAIIQRNLYGVDLEAFAANIAILRLWLSLIVDYRDADVHNQPPLPNLDFKIEVGDSLSAPDPRVYGDIFRTRALDDTDELALLNAGDNSHPPAPSLASERGGEEDGAFPTPFACERGWRGAPGESVTQKEPNMERNQPYSAQMTEAARRLRKEQTPAETRLWEMLRGRRCGGLRFLRQVPAGQYILDFYCASVRLAIEVDGSIHELPEIRQRDRDRQAALEEDLHLTILRLTNTEVLEGDTQTLQARIVAAAQVAAQRVPPWGERPARRR